MPTDDILIKPTEVHAAYDEFRRFTADPEMREKIKARERYWTDRKLDHAEAEEEGREKERLVVARNMLAKGLDNVLISEMTGLSLPDIECLG